MDEQRIEQLITQALLEKLSDYVLERYGTQVYEKAKDLVLRAQLSMEPIAEDELDRALEDILGVREEESIT